MSTTEGQMSIIDRMYEMSQSNFLTFGEDDEQMFKVLSEPTEGISKFPYPDGSPKPEIRFRVTVEGSTKVQEWPVSSKQVIAQFVAIARKEGLKGFTGCTFKVLSMGSDKSRKYFVKLVSKPEQKKDGAKWIEDQKAGAK